MRLTKYEYFWKNFIRFHIPAFVKLLRSPLEGFTQDGTPEQEEEEEEEEEEVKLWLHTALDTDRNFDEDSSGVLVSYHTRVNPDLYYP